jgi:hypothetical protein
MKGGARPGSGRPKIGERYTVVLNDETVAKARAIGQGNIGEGIRESVNARRIKKVTK